MSASAAAAKQAVRWRALRCRVNVSIKQAAADSGLLAKLEDALAAVETG